VCIIVASAAPAAAQSSPLPGLETDEGNGFLTRAQWLLSIGPIGSDDPRFAWGTRSRVDLDVARYPSGRVNLLFDNEIVLGRERREFDFNHDNIILETSASHRVRSVDASVVFHHTSRHVIDRAAGRVVAWHTVGGRLVRPFAIGESAAAASVEFHRVVQHTFVDYTWTSQAAVRLDRPLASGRDLFVNGSAGMVGVDRSALNRGNQVGGRLEGGMHLPGRRAAVDVFGAFERRIDGYPFEPSPVSLVEAGIRLGSR